MAEATTEESVHAATEDQEVAEDQEEGEVGRALRMATNPGEILLSSTERTAVFRLEGEEEKVRKPEDVDLQPLSQLEEGAFRHLNSMIIFWREQGRMRLI